MMETVHVRTGLMYFNTWHIVVFEAVLHKIKCISFVQRNVKWIFCIKG